MISLLLHFVRVGAFFAVVPIFGRNQDSRFLRLVLAIALGAMLWWVGDMRVDVPPNALAIGVVATREAVIGLALGLCFAAIYGMLTTAGEVVSLEMGFSMAQTINPDTGTSAAVISQLFQVIGALMVFALDLHHEALVIARDTFATLPVGQPFDVGPIWVGLQEIVSAAVQLALRLAMPIIGIMMLLSSGTVLIGRAVPSINMMEFAFGLRILVALGVMGFFIVESLPFVIAAYEDLFARTAATFGG
ncbi:MAG: flagellar biosynthetic protein FliR [Planctomycetes bacterium]|nr:flagellar biosynthetic protein FliR [Planctomycetota bacterium]